MRLLEEKVSSLFGMGLLSFILSPGKISESEHLNSNITCFQVDYLK